MRRPHLLWLTLEHNELCLNTGSLTLHLSHIHTQGDMKALSGMCAHVNNFFSNLVECVDFSDLSGATVGWFISFSE